MSFMKRPKSATSAVPGAMPQNKEALMKQFAAMREKADKTLVTGNSSQNLVLIAIDGNRAMKKITIHPDAVSDISGLQDLILQAHEDALTKLDEALGD